MYQQLAQLIRDAVWLKSYIAAVMRLAQEAFQQAYVALGSTNTNALAITMHGEPQPQGLIADQPHQPAHPLVARGGYEQVRIGNVSAAVVGLVGLIQVFWHCRLCASGNLCLCKCCWLFLEAHWI